MRILYIECLMGASGDMLTAALTELIKNPDSIIDELNALGIPGVKYYREKVFRCGIAGTHIKVTVNGEEEGHEHKSGHHHHSSMQDIEHIVLEHINADENIKKDILGVYRLLADAESHVHGVNVSEIHFHETGTADAIADIAAVCLLIKRIGADKIIVSPVNTGSGHVKCAHGILPVPAPAAAYLLKDIPVYNSGTDGELCTPTGAALIKYFASSSGNMPLMKIKKTGYGMGSRDFERANCVRAFLGESEDTENITELACNVDDMTGEETAYAAEQLYKAGAKEVFLCPVYMKKSRPGILIDILCRENLKDEILKTLFRHTSTIGVREYEVKRHVLTREIKTEITSAGTVRKKVSEGFGTVKEKYEYEDLAEIADKNNISLNEVKSLLRRENGDDIMP